MYCKCGLLSTVTLPAIHGELRTNEFLEGNLLEPGWRSPWLSALFPAPGEQTNVSYTSGSS